MVGRWGVSLLGGGEGDAGLMLFADPQHSMFLFCWGCLCDCFMGSNSFVPEINYSLVQTLVGCGRSGCQRIEHNSKSCHLAEEKDTVPGLLGVIFRGLVFSRQLQVQFRPAAGNC